MTKFKLKTCEPYIIKYPIPSLETKNSPIITPIIVRWRDYNKYQLYYY